MVTPKQPGLEYPIFEFVDGRSQDSDACTRQVSSEDQRAATLPQDTPLLPQDSEEFVFLWEISIIVKVVNFSCLLTF